MATHGRRPSSYDYELGASGGIRLDMLDQRVHIYGDMQPDTFAVESA
jgi:hypothetical protein